MSYLLDTCVLSELVKTPPSPRVLAWFNAGVDNDRLFISALTLGEIRKGVEKMPASARRRRIGAWLETELEAWFEGRVLPIDAAVADEWGRLQARSARTLPAVDSLIAATALRHRFPIVTRNVVDFLAAGVDVINPWEGE